jgi:hypothetical protein
MLTDPEGLRRVEVGGQRVSFGADGAVQALVPLLLGANEVKLAAWDGQGRATRHTRIHEVPMTPLGLLEPINAALVEVVPGGPSPSPPSKLAKLGSLLPLRLKISSCGRIEDRLARYPSAPTIIRIAKVGGPDIPLGTIVQGGGNGIALHLDGAIWSFDLPTARLGDPGNYVVTFRMPDGTKWQGIIALKR